MAKTSDILFFNESEGEMIFKCFDKDKTIISESDWGNQHKGHAISKTDGISYCSSCGSVLVTAEICEIEVVKVEEKPQEKCRYRPVEIRCLRCDECHMFYPASDFIEFLYTELNQSKMLWAVVEEAKKRFK